MQTWLLSKPTSVSSGFPVQHLTDQWVTVACITVFANLEQKVFETALIVIWISFISQKSLDLSIKNKKNTQKLSEGDSGEWGLSELNTAGNVN